MKIRFLKFHGDSRPGDTAEVADNLATKLVAFGIAEKVGDVLRDVFLSNRKRTEKTRGRS